ncbi:FG-nucleoporin nsp1 [Recurvomyces mirabilis]|uniref:Nucleoporin NSP1 n=1 Tax=Recurvomyces mirabilis TaxID=574656 RepID=A0AAE0TUU5_9PEZI|nr:FG-nucleoporin nsp1 [Recurvomyces mirabilis]KAK5155076.1 FG-nucleoporin nsp1 [Recurvomyces mirabilis]
MAPPPPPPPPSQVLPPHIIARQSRQPQLFITNKRPNVNRPPLGLNHAARQQPNPSLNLNSFSIPDTSDLLEATRRQVAADNASQGRPFWTTAAAKRPADENMAFNFGQQASSAGASGSAPATSGANDGGSIFGQSKTTAGSLFGRDTNAPTSGFGAAPASNAGGLFGNTNNSQAKPAGGFSFGQATGSTPASGTATPSAQPPSLFGGNSGSTGGMFGGGNNNNNNASANPFGSSTAGSSAPVAGSLFGAKPSASPAATPGEQPKAGGMFGSGAPASNTGGSLFGAAAASNQPSWSFGQNAPAAEQNQPASTQSVFGQSTSTTPADKPLFGAITPQNSKTAPPSFTPAGNPPSSSLFGGAGKQKENEPATSQPQQGGSLFGAKPAATQAPAFQFPGTAPTQSSSTPQSNNGGLFAPKTTAQGPNATPLAAPSLFGGAAQPQQSSSATPASSAPAAGGLFSNLHQPGDSAPAQAAGQGLFSGASGFKLPGAPASSTANQPTASTTSAPAPSFSFPTAGQTTSSAPAQPASTTAPAPSFSFTQPTPSTTSQTPAAAPAPAAGSGGLFGATAPAPAASGAGGSGGLFSGAAAPAASNAGGSGGGLFGAPASSQAAPAASSGAPAGGLFGNTAPAASQSTMTAAPAAPALAATASTTGPAPPQQSRLASKSMDEILTMWSTSLATHQKTFQQLAQRVSTWDRQLVENSSKISALYGRCFQAERDCSEVERQLGNVEHGQVELEALLDRYEGEVDRMMEGSGFGEGGGGGGGPGGVDRERERTYKTAESCSNRLTDMHHSLTSMIEEINVSSSSLSAANGGRSTSRNHQDNKDPLADIVTILNGHLSQLQAIDQGAAMLQGKVQLAQREARGLSERSGLGGGRGEWVEGFGRSYLGRR